MIYPNRQDADLVLSTLRHQRDLFSGGPSLGIPDVNTRVGSVIHAFENLAYQRQIKESAERPYESSKSSSSADKKDSVYKINLPTPSKNLATYPINAIPQQHIVRKTPKNKAPGIPSLGNTVSVSATTQTQKFSADENESSAVDSLNIESENLKHKKSNKFPQSYVKSYKVLPPFVPARKPSKIPTKAMKKIADQQLSRNQVKTTFESPKSRTNVFLNQNKFSEDDIENDFLRGSTVSQSFIKSVAQKSPNHRKMSTYEQNFLLNDEGDQNIDIKSSKNPKVERSSKNQRTRPTSKRIDQPLIDEVSLRYKKYSSSNNNDTTSVNDSARQTFKPSWNDHAEL